MHIGNLLFSDGLNWNKLRTIFILLLVPEEYDSLTHNLIKNKLIDIKYLDKLRKRNYAFVFARYLINIMWSWFVPYLAVLMAFIIRLMVIDYMSYCQTAIWWGYKQPFAIFIPNGQKGIQIISLSHFG
jgi:hypothetical protein